MSSPLSLTDMVRKLFSNADGTLKVREIYDAIEKKHPLSSKQRDFTRYNEPLFHHELRAIISQLFQQCEIIRVSRGEYKIAMKHKKAEERTIRHWCISTSPENWEICKQNGVWGMDERYFVTIEKFLKSGDKAVVYNHGGKFVALVIFVRDYFHSEKHLGWKKGKKEFLFPYRIQFKIISESKNPPQISFSTEEQNNKAQWNKANLIDDIVFIADKGRTWNQYVQVSIIRITEEDFKYNIQSHSKFLNSLN